MVQLRKLRAGESPRVAVFGAAGHTGGFVLSELIRRGIEPIAVVRSAKPLIASHTMEIREASIDDPTSLDRAFAGSSVIINCAGPFLDTGTAVAEAALRSRAHYLDLSAEQQSVCDTYDVFDSPARRDGLIVIPAMGFFGGFADLLVTAAMSEWKNADDIKVFVALDSWHATSGTRATGKRNTAQRLVDMNGQLVPLPQPASEMEWVFPEPFAREHVIEVPFSEIIVTARHVRSAQIHTFLNLTALRDVRDENTPEPIPADEAGRSAQCFLVQAVVRRGSEVRRFAGAGQDIYAFTAPLVCEAAQRLLIDGTLTAGAHAPGAIFDAHDFLSALEKADPTFHCIHS